MVVSIKDFVKAALLEISDAVVEARKESRVNIAPGYVEGIAQIEPQSVQFELLVEVTSESTKAGDAKVEVPVLGIVRASAGIDAKNNRNTTNSQKISFSVPIYFQAPKNEEDR
ncbi:hypothetical protein [Pseudodonghicola flavimaris]|uniref:Uncharacterized protein n=1 Tax=Pseudodonghicola flavimaris TaxID=3050036 RepID=A0ABT7F7E7_9RHOB|nr:hypothetical protein [Pseudodonghicola flavimaris]MDK3020528.1 hypothetical protein [Pseudodonghicola flavimaris]